VEERVRQRGRNNEYVFTHTKKRNISDVKRVEIERQIDVTKYVQLLMRADPTRRQIVKTRYCVMENDLIYELDVFSSAEWNGKALLEIELSHEDAPFTLPDWVDKEQAHEVTFDKAYTNAALAMIPGKGPQTEGCDKVPHN
jgi:CYTH domain-containing protein